MLWIRAFPRSLSLCILAGSIFFLLHHVDGARHLSSRSRLRGGNSLDRTQSSQISETDLLPAKLGVAKGAKQPAPAARKQQHAKEPKAKLCIVRPNAKIIQTSALEAASTGDVEELERLFSIDPTSVDSKARTLNVDSSVFIALLPCPRVVPKPAFLIVSLKCTTKCCEVRRLDNMP